MKQKNQPNRKWVPAPDKPFVDRLAELWAARTDTFNKATGGTSDVDLTPGRKRMAGMP